MNESDGTASHMRTPGIDRVIGRLEEIVRWAIEEDSRHGYFASLYLEVTRAVRRRLLDGAFEDAARMDRLDARFAQRYLDAFDAARRGEPTTASWQTAFDTVPRFRPVILQHLLLGMNAHINLDLGIAAAEVAGETPLAALREDFMRVNRVLSELTDEVQRRVALSAPLLRALDFFAGRGDEMLADFSIEKARDGAYAFAQELHALPASARQECIESRDAAIATLARGIARPGIVLSAVLLPLRLLETGGPATITQRLSSGRDASP